MGFSTKKCINFVPAFKIAKSTLGILFLLYNHGNPEWESGNWKRVGGEQPEEKATEFLQEVHADNSQCLTLPSSWVVVYKAQEWEFRKHSALLLSFAQRPIFKACISVLFFPQKEICDELDVSWMWSLQKRTHSYSEWQRLVCSQFPAFPLPMLCQITIMGFSFTILVLTVLDFCHVTSFSVSLRDPPFVFVKCPLTK